MHNCDRCQVNPGTFVVRQSIDGKSKEERICETCLKEQDILADQPKPNGMDFNFSQLLGTLGQLMEQDQSNLENRRSTSPSREMKVPKSRKSLLSQFSTNLTSLARNGEIDDVIGRDQEIERLLHILNRKTKNNPVLLGEPGVGKTAIAEGLALKIVEKNVPEKLQGKEVYALDISALTAGTMYRGMFEDRMKKLLEEIEANDKVLLFIDELHMIMGAGSSMDSNMDVANILKPYLSRGRIQLIGATTTEEYRKIEKDTALGRRFQAVSIKEPNLAETLDILKGLRPRYEDYHGVSFNDGVLEQIVRLSDRYLSERFMPDKAIDLLDEIGSQLNLKHATTKQSKEIETLKQLELEEADNGNYERAMEYRTQHILLAKQIPAPRQAAVEDIERIIEQMTGIPVQKISTQERSGLSTLTDTLNAAVIGQEDSVDAVVKAVKRHRLNLRRREKPITFLFSGPTGVGKTELTKQLAKELFGSTDHIVRFDMSEYMEEHSLSKMIGSPPGYIGHDEAGQLTEKIRRKPYSVVLLDEFEKAHPKIQHLFLQVFDDGRLTDSQGKTVDFSHTIIIMTSNLGATSKAATGFLQSGQEQYVNAIHDHFSPEFINRIDAIIPFDHLEAAHMEQIADLLLQDLFTGLADQQITLTIDPEVKRKLAEKGYDQKYGARPLLRTLTAELEDPITDLLIVTPTLSSIHVKMNPQDGTDTFVFETN